MDVASSIWAEKDAFPWSTERETARFISALAVMTDRNSALELGTFKGATTMRLLEEGISTITIDIDDRRSPLFRDAIRDGIFIKGDSRTHDFGDRKFDLIYFDSDHAYEQVWAEFRNLRDHMTDDCILVFHDTINHPGPKQFIEEMESSGALNILTLPTPRGCGLTLATLP